MTFMRVDQLTPDFRQGAILVRVSRLWDYRGGTDYGDIIHVGMVLIDEQKNAIYAEIGRDEVSSKKPLLAEGEIYVLKRFRVTKSKSTFRSVDSPYMIHITCHTLIEKVREPVPNIPLYAYSLTRFTDITSRLGETKSFIDLIGIISEVHDIEEVHVQQQTKSTPKRMIVVKDSKQHLMKIAIWGQKAQQFDADAICDLGQESPVVVIFVGLLAKTYKGECILSGNTACRWYINPEVPETQMLLNSIGSNFHPIVRVPHDSVDHRIREPLAEPASKTLLEIKETNPYDFPREGFRCTVTLLKYNNTQLWWFPSCNICSHACAPEGEGYKCLKDNCRGYRFKYKLFYIATDGTTEVELAFFHETGHRLIGKDVKLMMRMYPMADEIPTEMAAQVGQTYDVTVNITKKAFESLVYPYEVKRIHTCYGRQPVVPTALATAATQGVHQAKPADVSGSSSAQPVQNQQQDNVDITFQHSQTTHESDKNSTPPPPPLPTDETPLPVTKSSSPKPSAKKRNVRRELFSSYQEAGDDNPELENTNLDVVRGSSSSNAAQSGEVRPASPNRTPLSKKPKKG